MWLEGSTVSTAVNTSRQLRACSRPAKLTTHDPPRRWRHGRVGGTNTPRPNSRRMSSGESGSTWTTSRFSRNVSLSQKDLAIRKAGSRPKEVASGGHKPQDQVSSSTRKNSCSTRDIHSRARKGQSVWDYTSERGWRRRTRRDPKHGSHRQDTRRGSGCTRSVDHGRHGHRTTASMTSQS